MDSDMEAGGDDPFASSCSPSSLRIGKLRHLKRCSTRNVASSSNHDLSVQAFQHERRNSNEEIASEEMGGLTDQRDGIEPLFENPTSFETAFIGENGEGNEERIGLQGVVRERIKRKKFETNLLNLGDTQTRLTQTTKKVRRTCGLQYSEKTTEPKLAVTISRRLDKENKAHLDQLHAESQRLLRETRNVSFKPVVLSIAPISSVLEKIRIRKMEVAKSCGIEGQIDSSAIGVSSVEDTNVGIDFPTLSCCNEMINSTISEVEDANVLKGKEILGSPCSSESIRSKDASCSSHSADSEDNSSHYIDTVQQGDNSLHSSPREVLEADSLDILSSESDKEDIVKYHGKIVRNGSYRKHDFVKSFLDDEAEEEDNSDHDLTRFQEDDEDEGDDGEELTDVIAHGYKEAPIDHERRNHLHQKWLEQQDATVTENILSRLNCGTKSRELMLQDEELNSDGDAQDEATENDVPGAIIKKNFKKAKEMMMRMFDGPNNHDLINSDEDEADNKLLRQRFTKQTEKDSSFVSPLEDESSREFFSLIKKPSVTIDSKKMKQAKMSLDMLITRKKNSPPKKSSFVGRASSNLLPSFHKQGSSTLRAFIYGRDDSNSRSSFISASDNNSSTEQKEINAASGNKRPVRSLLKSNSIAAEDKPSSESSLFNILRSSSATALEKKNGEKGNIQQHKEIQISSHFSAFKLGRNFSRSDVRNISADI